jgi:hypothetical protein
MGRQGLARSLSALCAGVTLLVAGAGAAGANEPSARGASAAGAVAAERVSETPAEIREYWTESRMREAKPLAPLTEQVGGAFELPPARGAPAYVRPSASGGDPRPARLVRGAPEALRAEDVSGQSSGSPLRLHGKVYLRLGGANYFCSATVVTSNQHTLAWTAGHCVHGADLGLGFAENWLFVPGYRDGARPFGTWTAKNLYTTDGWRRNANVRYDLGAARLARDPQGRGIEDVVGARGIAFNQPRDQLFDLFGYPAEDPLPLLPPNYDGERLFLCRSPHSGDDSPAGGSGPETLEARCDMSAGASGGGWVIKNRYLNSVISYGYEFDVSRLYGPYQGTLAKLLYERASGPPLRCGGVEVTNLGEGGRDRFEGTGGADGFRLAGGKDRATGKGGRDAACGGGGGDRLAGGGARDVLRGGPGRDVLVGGPGRDVCVGGPGRDRASSCARMRSIP